uniref:MADF domain-containing protein n=1 Tax=Anopheles culicifacies TaxID=139723 RepID=A0A182MDW6_9DIPT
MTKFIEHLKLYDCLYDVNADIHSEESAMCWKLLSRQMRFNVLRCQRYWKQKLESYAKFLETGDTDPTPAMAEMEFVRNDVHQLLERAKQLCASTRAAEGFKFESSSNLKTDSKLIKVKREMLNQTQDDPQDMQVLLNPPPKKQARRNTVREVVSDTHNKTKIPFVRTVTSKSQHSDSSLPRLQSFTKPITTVTNEKRVPFNGVGEPQSSGVMLPKEGMTKQMVWNLPAGQRNNEVLSDNLPLNLHAFGRPVESIRDAMLTAFPQISYRGLLDPTTPAITLPWDIPTRSKPGLSRNTRINSSANSAITIVTLLLCRLLLELLLVLVLALWVTSSEVRGFRLRRPFVISEISATCVGKMFSTKILFVCFVTSASSFCFKSCCFQLTRAQVDTAFGVIFVTHRYTGHAVVTIAQELDAQHVKLLGGFVEFYKQLMQYINQSANGQLRCHVRIVDHIRVKNRNIGVFLYVQLAVKHANMRMEFLFDV